MHTYKQPHIITHTNMHTYSALHSVYAASRSDSLRHIACMPAPMCFLHTERESLLIDACALIINIQLPRSKHTCVIMCLYFYTFASSKNLQVSPCESLRHNLAQSQKPPSHLRMSLKSAKVCEAAALSPAGLSPRVEKNIKLPMWRHELCHPLWQKPPVLPRRRHGQWSVMPI